MLIVKSKPVGWQRALFGSCEILLFPHPNLLPEGEEIFPLLVGDEKHCFARGEVYLFNNPHPLAEYISHHKGRRNYKEFKPPNSLIYLEQQFLSWLDLSRIVELQVKL